MTLIHFSFIRVFRVHLRPKIFLNQAHFFGFEGRLSTVADA